LAAGIGAKVLRPAIEQADSATAAKTAATAPKILKIAAR
jgi:hypothetical protein